MALINVGEALLGREVTYRCFRPISLQGMCTLQWVSLHFDPYKNVKIYVIVSLIYSLVCLVGLISCWCKGMKQKEMACESWEGGRRHSQLRGENVLQWCLGHPYRERVNILSYLCPPKNWWSTLVLLWNFTEKPKTYVLIFLLDNNYNRKCSPSSCRHTPPILTQLYQKLEMTARVEGSRKKREEKKPMLLS